LKLGVPEPSVLATRLVDVDTLGECLSALRLCDRGTLAAMRRSLEEHGQLTALVVFPQAEQLEIIDGFKRVRAARALGWRTLAARVVEVGPIDAKLHLRELHGGRALTELEEAWLVRSLYREDHLSQPDIARLLSRHKSWVWRRLMLVEALDSAVQSNVRLGLIAPRAAVAVSRLPRGNQPAASAVVMRRGLTVPQAELLVAEALEEKDPTARAALLARRLDGPLPTQSPGPRPSRAVHKSEADWMSADILRVRELAARLEARLMASPLEVFTPAAAELMRDALVRLSPVLRALDGMIGRITGQKDAA
jgi:ParB-like chromosome segregation protein Spo0J